MTAALNLVSLLASIALKLTNLSFRLLFWLVNGVARLISARPAARRAYPGRKPTIIRKPPRNHRRAKWQKRRK